MKTIVIFITFALLVVFVTSCTSVSYNPETKEMTYTRIGSFKAKDILIELKNGAAYVEVGSTESDSTEFVKRLIEMGIEIGKAGI